MDIFTLLAILAILGAIICFIVELVRSGFSLTVFGLLFLSLFFAFNFFPTIS